MSEIKTGSPVVLTDASGLEDFDLHDGQKGWVNSIAAIPGDKTYVFFMPVVSKTMTVVDIGRVEFDEERAGLELNENTIHKD